MVNRRWLSRLPWEIVVMAAMLILLGWVGINRAEELADREGRFLPRQMSWLPIALVAMFGVALPSYRPLCRWSYAIFGLAMLGLLLVYFFPPVNGARRWIRLGPIGCQPSEFAKIAFVMATARYLMYRENYRRFTGLFAPLALVLVPCVLILREPDLGTALLFPPVLFAMLYVAGARSADLLKLVLIGMLCTPLLWTQMTREQKSRITALAESTSPGHRPSDDAYHLQQSKRMIGLGNTWGSFVQGDAVPDRGAYRLPEAHTDFIFAVICERLGLAGGAFVLGLFGLLIWRGATVAIQSREPYGRLLAAGLTALFAVQVAINTAMTIGLAPVTGLSLPLVSYGGSGLLAHAIGLGLLLNVGARPGYEVGPEPFRYRIEAAARA